MSLSLGAHKKLLIARLTAQGAQCLLVDEPLRDVAVAEEEQLMELLHQVAKRQAVVLVTHNKIEARRLCDTICLITGGRVVEVTPAEEFFQEPRTPLGREFLKSGSCWPIDLFPTETTVTNARCVPEPARSIRPPRDFHWVILGLLGGMQKPGLLGDEDADLEGLRGLGVCVLVTLTEEPFDGDKLARFGLEGEHFPIVDMSVPTLDEALLMCQRISSLIDEQQPAVIHCKAGLGRTGTILACVLVYRGLEAVQAIDRVRMVRPGYIQTDEQLDFISRFALHLERTGDQKGRAHRAYSTHPYLI